MVLNFTGGSMIRYLIEIGTGEELDYYAYCLGLSRIGLESDIDLRIRVLDLYDKVSRSY
jgi:hypothetical protein